MIKMESSVKSKLEPDESVTKRSVCTSDSHFVWKVLLVLIAGGYVVFSVYEIIELKSSVRNLQIRVDVISSRCIPDQPKGDNGNLPTATTSSRSKRSVILGEVDVNTALVGEGYARSARVARQVSPKGDPGPKGGNGGIAGGSTFIYWGQRICEGDTKQIYHGFAAAALPFAGYGGSSKLECLPVRSMNSGSLTLQSSRTVISAVKLSSNNKALPCSVCFTDRTPQVMIPASSECPNNLEWRKEYDGYLMSTPGIPLRYYFSSMNYCVHKRPDTSALADRPDSRGLKLTFVQADRCTQSFCSEYSTRTTISCVVCTKKRLD